MKVYLLIVLVVCAELTDIRGQSQNDDGIQVEATDSDSHRSNTQEGGYVYQRSRPSDHGFDVKWDPNGYLFFCLSMGRIGNQMEHFLGGLAFANEINRTLILPPFRTYRNIRFTEWFHFEPLLKYHRVILAEDFMDFLAAEHWPEGKRIGFCYRPGGNTDFECTLKEGYPFKPFWDGLGVDFDRYDWLDYSYQQPQKFADRYPGSKYPVLALRGAPASFPMSPNHWPLQRHLVFSDRINSEADAYIQENFPGEKFVGIHLRNGGDWENACKSVLPTSKFMASPQCLHGTSDLVTKKMCFPSSADVLRLVKDVVVYSEAKVVFVATDKNPMIDELTEHLAEQKVKVFHMDPHLPLIDQAILVKADYFIGNCVSSFSSFVTRARKIVDKPTVFFAYD